MTRERDKANRNERSVSYLWENADGMTGWDMRIQGEDEGLKKIGSIGPTRSRKKTASGQMDHLAVGK